MSASGSVGSVVMDAVIVEQRDGVRGVWVYVGEFVWSAKSAEGW